MTNQLILGDNLEKMKVIDTASVDLIYLDPPFFSNRNYEVIWGDAGEKRSFEDRWAGGIEHYIAWLKERVEQMYRLLKPTGTIFLHCDWHAQAYIKVDILDKIFGINNYVNEIVWCYTAPANVKNRFPQKHDTIYFYAKGNDYFFSTDHIKIPYNQETVARTHRGAGDTGLKVKGNAEERHKNRLDEDGKVPEDYWIDIPRIQGNGNERIGYPTQKPEALLERIIKAASHEGDTVLDPFVGGGTTVAVADKLNRKWIGIDQSAVAIKVTDLRLRKQKDLYSEPYNLNLGTYDYDELRSKDAFDFEKWIIEQAGGTGNDKQRTDLGIDGKMADGTPVQVKRSDNVGRNVIDNFLSAIQRYDQALYDKNTAEGKTAGYIIAFSFNKGAIEEVARLKNKQKPIIELKRVADIVPYAKRPVVSLDANKVEAFKYEFQATAQSDVGIEFYSWDFNHNPEEGFKADILRDKTGKQEHTFQPGEHTVAVEAIDKLGLEGGDTINIKVNKTDG